MKTNLNILPILCFLLLWSCKSGNASSQTKNEVSQDTIKTFTLPAIPQIMVAPEQRAEFLVKHYWDNVNFADTNYIHHPEITEQAWVDYCDILNHVPLKTAQEAIRKTIDRTNVDKKVFAYITDLADKYLYDPNSPMRNEEFYIPVLEAMAASPVLEEIEKVRPKARLELAQKNRIGTKAINFTCTETIEGLKQAPIISQLIKEKKLIVLSIYPDEELDDWRKHLNEFPKEWINGYDKKFTIKEKQLYDLKAIPTLYLLNKEKTVLLKDATTQAIEEYLMIHQ